MNNKYIKHTREDYLNAIKQNPNVIKYLKQITKINDKHEYYTLPDEEMYLLAVKQDGMLLQYVKQQTPDICLAALEQNPNALQFVKIKNIKLLYSL